MSQENVEMVRRVIDSINQGCLALEDASDNFEMDWSNSVGPLKGVYRGEEQVNEVFRSFQEVWDRLRWDIQEVIDLEGGRVLIVNRVRMRGRTSRVEVEATGIQLWTIHDGKLASVKLYQSKLDALEALGLSE
jgi:ketosteroid isomerase-like protein